MVMAQSLFMSLKLSFPGCLIDVLAPAWPLPLLDRMPEVSKAIVIPLNRGQFGVTARIKLGRQLQAERYELALLLTALLGLDFLVKIQLGTQALFTAKIFFLLDILAAKLGTGRLWETLPYGIPLCLILIGAVSFGRNRLIRIERASKTLVCGASFYFLPVHTVVLPAESAKEIWIEKRRLATNRYVLGVEDAQGKRTKFEESGSREKLKTHAKMIQELTGLGLNYRI
jgi:hypothetical protein